jgi:hypothetical protein
MANSIDPVTYSSITTPAAAGTWVSVNLTALAQYWLNVAGANHGMVVLSPTEEKKDESRFNAREASSGLQPRLEIVTANGNVSPVTVTTTATLTGKSGPADNISRSLTQSGITAWQSPVEQVLQPGGDTGKDVSLKDWKLLQNYGKSGKLEVSYGSGNTSRSLLQFTLDIPPDAEIESATLSLYQRTASASDAVANVQRITTDWVEGSSDGGIGAGATWLARDGLLLWSSLGGEMDPRVFATTAIASGTTGWASWDISELVQGWADGSYPNYGLAVLAGSGTTNLSFNSSDVGDKDAAQRPMLTIRYRCECGSPCLAAKGSGNMLMVVNNASSLSSGDSVKKARFESWGYVVTPISDSSLRLVINLAAADQDLIYVSDSVRAAVLGDKLTDLAIGIVSESGDMNSKLGFAASHGYAVSPTINISDNSHFISAVFPRGPLELNSGAMEQQVMAGGMASGSQQLGDTGGQGSLAILEAGAGLGGGHIGETASGRRVLLPLGRNAGLNWDFVDGNGLIRDE